MTAADILNVAGFAVAGAGSALGMFGIFKQTNAYYPFRLSQFREHLYRVARKWVKEGRAAAMGLVSATVTLGEKRGEDRTQSMIGLYCVLGGFFLQLFGSSLLLLGALLGGSGSPH
jgi:hypothetical protein